jgi:hypothetical protein
MQGLRPDDIERSEYIGRDAVTIIEGEFRQFQGRAWDTFQRYVENLVTGTFIKVTKNVDLSGSREDTIT